MFPTFIGILDIQSWWEVPSIAHFCSLFRAAFNLLDFDIEDLEEALLTDGGTEGRLLQELIVRLLEGCLPNDTRNDISTFNYQMFLRRLFRKKCQEYKCENPFNTDVDFELLPLRQKVEILRALCDFRLDAEDVEQSLSNLDSDSLRVEPLGHDRKNSAYWYFYGTRLYREDYIDTSDNISYRQKSKSRDKKRKKRRDRVAKEEEEEEEEEEDSIVYSENKGRESVWQVVCFTQQDWSRLVEKFRDSEYDTERKLYRTLSEDFMPEIPKLFDLKEKQQRRKLLQRNNSRVLRSHEPALQMDAVMVRSKIKTKPDNKGLKKSNQNSKATYLKEDASPPLISPPVQKKGRQTNNSLASAVGQIVIHTRDEEEDLEKKKGMGKHGVSNYVSSNYGYKYGYSFGIEEEERRVGMHKVLESLKDHVDAWPFIDPVDEEYAPRYYSVVRKPMDLSTMEEKLEGGSYKNLTLFKRDFRLIVDNCRQYNGSDNEYTEMAINLKEAFDKAVNRYLESETSSDEGPSSPKPLVTTPVPLNSPSPHNIRKRSKKSEKKAKTRSDSKIKSKDNEKAEEQEKKSPTLKTSKDKKGKKKSKKSNREQSVENEEEQENESVESEIIAPKSKRRKQVDTNSLPLKTKKLAPKEPEELKKASKKVGKERYQQKKDKEAVQLVTEVKENKKRKENFEEGCEPLIIAKSKSRKIEKREIEDTEILTERTKKNRLKKIELQQDDLELEQNDKESQPVKVKKSCKKEKPGVNSNSKTDEKSEVKNQTKEKEKKSKQKSEELLKNGKINTDEELVHNDIECKAEGGKADASKKIDTLVGDKDLESLDSLKDKISERRRKEALKLEKEKKKKPTKTDINSTNSKKVPSNGSTFHDGDRIGVKRPKPKKVTKDKKNVKSENDDKDQDLEPSESKKGKTVQAKHIKVYGKEESSAIQALNQATEQTLNDINKWLDDAPRLSEFSSGSDSPVFPASAESGRSGTKTETARKRLSSMKIFGPHGPTRPKKIQRTIDRLQPGKSKGNLLLKKPVNLQTTNTSDTAANPLSSDSDQPSKGLEEEPKLSLGTVLKNVDSIQLICKSIVSSPNPNLSNDEDEDDHSAPPTASSGKASSVKEEKVAAGKGTTLQPSTTEETKDNKSGSEETQKPKSATPNLSAWFKAFGAPKSKKKEEEGEDSAAKKDGDLQSVVGSRQRRMSTGGSSISGSVSSFSQESPPGHASRSPQNQPAITLSEPQVRGAGFYQDALSTGSSPYNSPYYATPPRYSAQLPPTPSPQNHPLSPAYPSSASYEQPPLYPQAVNQPSHQAYQKSPQDGTVEAYRQLSPTFAQQSPQNPYPQNSPQCDSYPQSLPSGSQNQSPIYPQQSPQPIQPVYPQPASQGSQANYSQPSPQQPATPKYSQPSPQPNSTPNYSQPSPQAASAFSAQPSPQQQHSPYSQPSPQPPPTYSQQSPQQQHSPYAQTSPQQTSGYSQLSPQPPSNYSQPSPQPPPAYPQQTQPAAFPQSSPHSAGYSQPSPQPPAPFSQTSPQPPTSYSQPSPQPPASYSQPSPQPRASYSQPSPQPPASYSQPSPQSRNFAQPSPQQQSQTFSQHSPQAASTYSQPSPQSIPYSSQPSPQPPPNYAQPSPQPPANYSHPMHSPQAPSNYSQLSPQQPTTATNYPQLSPQQTHSYPQHSPQQKAACPPSQSVQQPTNYSQPSPQQSSSNYTQPQLTKQPNQPAAYLQSPRTSTINETERRSEYLKHGNDKSLNAEQQQRNFASQSEASLSLNSNHHVYQSSGQYPSTFLGKTVNAGDQLQPQDQSQLLAFQQNLPSHEPLYQPSFQAAGYPMPNTRPMYPTPHYFDAASKSSGASTSVGNLPPVKKRMYNESSAETSRNLPQDPSSRAGQEQFGFDPMIGLSQPPETPSTSQYDSAFVGSLADSVASNPAYARLGLGLVGRAGKEQQQLLTIPRPPPAKPEHLTYARSPIPGSAELDLNLLQSLQSTATKGAQGILSMPRRGGETASAPAVTTTGRPRKSKKSKQQQQQQDQQSSVATSVASVVSTDQQASAGIPGYPQYPVSAAESIGLKNSSVVPPGGSAFNFAAPTSTASTTPFYDKDATAAAAAFAFLDEFRNPNSYYSMALRQQQQQQQHQQPTPVTDSAQAVHNKLTNQPPRNYAPHPFLHSTQRSAPYGPPPVSAYVTPHGPNLAVDPAAYQQYIHSLYALQPPPHHHRPSWL